MKKFRIILAPWCDNYQARIVCEVALKKWSKHWKTTKDHATSTQLIKFWYQTRNFLHVSTMFWLTRLIIDIFLIERKVWTTALLSICSVILKNIRFFPPHSFLRRPRFWNCIHILLQHNFGLFWPTHYVSIGTILNVSKTGHFLDPHSPFLT